MILVNSKKYQLGKTKNKIQITIIILNILEWEGVGLVFIVEFWLQEGKLKKQKGPIMVFSKMFRY